MEQFITHTSWQKTDHSVLVSSGQEKNCLWTRLHNRTLELKDRRKRDVRQKIKQTMVVSSEVERRCYAVLSGKTKVLRNFTEQYLEDLLVQNCSRQNLVELVSILIPKKSAEPYRNIKNFGILLDLEKIFGESKNKLMSKPSGLDGIKSAPTEKENSNLRSNTSPTDNCGPEDSPDYIDTKLN